MKCDELKIENACVYGPDAKVYLAEQVDPAIAELKDEIKRKEGVGQRWFEQCMEARTENVRQKRALWLARAERAIAEAEYWYGHCSGMYYIDATDVPDEEDNPYERVKDTTIGWYKTWMNVERKCRAKAEEYK